VVGATLLHYRIVGTLGTGAMGEVYAAEDTRLNRRVALKLLPPATAVDPERLLRFRREAQAIAALNHPNVVTIYAVEEAGGIHFLTMELIEGTTLAEAIGRTGVAWRDFFTWAIPLIDAISAAHQHGIIHGDLKPSNVMIGPGGQVKVLDFGVATLKDDAGRPTATGLQTTVQVTAPHQ
jgi:serine/threonine protein kinase